MFTYRNTRTGAVITVPCPVKGEWELLEPEAKQAKPQEEPAPKPKRTRTKKK